MRCIAGRTMKARLLPIRSNYPGASARHDHPAPVHQQTRGIRSAPQECQTMFVRLSAAIAALGLLTGAALAQGAKPNDPQIAHIAYTAGVIDIAAEETVTSVLNKAGTVEYYCRFHPNMKAVLTIVP
jgi:hypothetical protein